MNALPVELVRHAAAYLALADMARLQTTCRRMLGALAGDVMVDALLRDLRRPRLAPARRARFCAVKRRRFLPPELARAQAVLSGWRRTAEPWPLEDYVKLVQRLRTFTHQLQPFDVLRVHAFDLEQFGVLLQLAFSNARYAAVMVAGSSGKLVEFRRGYPPEHPRGSWRMDACGVACPHTEPPPAYPYNIPAIEATSTRHLAEVAGRCPGLEAVIQGFITKQKKKP